MRTLIPLACAAWMIALCPCWAAEQDRRFLEFPNDNDTTTFDLSTVQIVQPGRFTVIATKIDSPDVMALELKALDTLRTYCARPAGKYPAPADLLTLGPPDMPVENIVVKSSRTSKWVYWSYPYKRLAMSTTQGLDEKGTILYCREQSKTEAQFFLERRAEITNGSRMKHLFDCRRGLSGMFFNNNDDSSKAITSAVKRGTFGEDKYFRVCVAVMHEMPYLPERSGKK